MTVGAMEHRRLGASGLDVSVLALGSWRTYERIPHEQGLEVMRAARELGIDFLDDARYDDESGTAPIRTGYSEVVFGELLRRSGWPSSQPTGRSRTSRWLPIQCRRRHPGSPSNTESSRPASELNLPTAVADPVDDARK